MSYGTGLAEAYHRAGVYAGKPQGREARRPAGPATDQVRADRNLKTARALRLDVTSEPRRARRSVSRRPQNVGWGLTMRVRASPYRSGRSLD